MQSRETQITMVKWTNAGGQTKRANERSFVYRPPAWRRWRHVKTTYRSTCFPGLIYCDRTWLLFLGVQINISYVTLVDQFQHWKSFVSEQNKKPTLQAEACLSHSQTNYDINFIVSPSKRLHWPRCVNVLICQQFCCQFSTINNWTIWRAKHVCLT